MYLCTFIVICIRTIAENDFALGLLRALTLINFDDILSEVVLFRASCHYFYIIADLLNFNYLSRYFQQSKQKKTVGKCRKSPRDHESLSLY